MAGMLIVIVFVSLTVSLAQPSGEIFSNNDDISLNEMVLELKNVVIHENERITALEKKCQSLEERNSKSSEEITALMKKIKTQDLTIAKLNKNVRECEKTVKEVSDMFYTFKLGKQRSLRNTVYSTGSSVPRKERLISTQTTAAPNADNTVAFYAYASQKISNPSSHFILTFDTIITNAGDSFHHHSGTFITPRTGFYVFTWSFRLQNDAHISTELVVNNAVKGSVYFDAHPGVGGNSGGTVVIHVNQGDDVFVRTTQFANLGDILSDHIGRTYFAGWLLA